MAELLDKVRQSFGQPAAQQTAQRSALLLQSQSSRACREPLLDHCPAPGVWPQVVHNRLHRVYICDDNLGPMGVITLTDILRKLLNS